MLSATQHKLEVKSREVAKLAILAQNSFGWNAQRSLGTFEKAMLFQSEAIIAHIVISV